MAKSVPLPVIDTPNLVIREMCLSDWRALARFLPHAKAEQSDPEAVRRHVARAVAQQDLSDRESFYLVAEQHETGTLIADALIRFHETGVAELFWNIDNGLNAQEFGCELVQILVALAIERLGADHVWCKIAASQPGKLAEAKAAGMADERTISCPKPAAVPDQELFVLTLTARDYFEETYA